MITIIYFVVILIATFLGAIAGLGGGVIIKPILDFVGAHDINTISFLSSSAVFTMAFYSTIKQLFNKVKLDYVVVLLISVGAIIGGNWGGSLFSYVLTIYNPTIVKCAQSLILAVLLIAVLINVNGNFKTYKIKNKILVVGVGLLLGIISTFLGIGGGPINVAVFIMFFSVDIKKATVYSIATILFSQGSKLVTIASTTGFGIFDLNLLWYTLPAALLGGILGTYINKKATTTIVHKIFIYSVVFIILLNIYNAISIFF
ncbi:MAG: sulfite exporter TauE/SafE family protein [Longicatena sp.]